MEKFNVICCHCGRKEYNPNIPEGHIIDCCSSIKCREESEGIVVGFKNGKIQDNSLGNLYLVRKNDVVIRDYQLPIEDYDLVNMYATAKFDITQGDFKQAIKVLKSNELANTPEGLYLFSRIHFKAYNNPSLGVKCLKQSAESGFPTAMAEYGYIITMAKYGRPAKPDKGIGLLLEADNKGSIEAAAYLVDVYMNGPANSNSYQTISKTKWFEYAEKAAIETKSYDSCFLLGYFYQNGMGTNQDLLKAYEWLKQSADQEYVVAYATLVELIIDNIDDPFFSLKLNEAKIYTDIYLAKAKYKNTEQYESMKFIKEVVLPDLEKQ
jgi:TPR repeat protein